MLSRGIVGRLKYPPKSSLAIELKSRTSQQAWREQKFDLLRVRGASG
jgi:hypothetical protein